jgi:transcriptional regulator GlxA family with amidase domain
MKQKRVGIVIFDDVEVLDFCGPFEVFSAVRLNEDKRREEPSPFEVLLVAEKRGPVSASGGMQVIPHCTYDQHVVADGRLLTSAGISAGIDMALQAVARHCGETVARATAKHMEYPYPDSNVRRVSI